MGVVFKSILYELFLRQKNDSDIKRARKQKKKQLPVKVCFMLNRFNSPRVCPL